MKRNNGDPLSPPSQRVVDDARDVTSGVHLAAAFRYLLLLPTPSSKPAFAARPLAFCEGSLCVRVCPVRGAFVC